MGPCLHSCSCASKAGSDKLVELQVHTAIGATATYVDWNKNKLADENQYAPGTHLVTCGEDGFVKARVASQTRPVAHLTRAVW